MGNLLDVIPEVEVMLAMEPEELGGILLRLASGNRQNGMFLEQHVLPPHPHLYSGPHTGGRGYPSSYEHEVELALAEAWLWLRINLLVVPAPAPNGTNGWMQLSRKGRAVLEDSSFKTYVDASRFPRGMIHPSLLPDVWLNLVRGDYDTAVFLSFKALEATIRDACEELTGERYATSVGVDLVRKAFHPEKGPLTDHGNVVPGERDALSNLMAGALGSYKNPHSHRYVKLENATEAFEMVVLASHLLRIVEVRREAAMSIKGLGQ
jgi:uncharacterized protein (TIGR02391 family)